MRTTATNHEGQYIFAQVTPGVYSVTVIASGFVQAVVSSVTVEVGKTSTINVSLRLGSTAEVVEVRWECPDPSLFADAAWVFFAEEGDRARAEVVELVERLRQGFERLAAIPPAG